MIKKLCLSILLASNAAFAAQTIVINANVITIDPSRPSAQAFAYENGKFLAIGSNAEILKLKTPEATVIDMHGATVVPGFNDAHLHPQQIYDEGSVYYRVWLGADRAKTMDQLIAEL